MKTKLKLKIKIFNFFVGKKIVNGHIKITLYILICKKPLNKLFSYFKGKCNRASDIYIFTIIFGKKGKIKIELKKHTKFI